MIKIKFAAELALVLAFSVLGPSLKAENICQPLLVGTNPSRQEIKDAALRDASDSGRPAAWISELRGPEDQVLPVLGNHQSHILSLGSGPDIFRPLYDFPAAGHFHLLDALTGWGTKGPRLVISELRARLKAISSNAKIRCLSKGFLSMFSARQLRSSEAMWKHMHLDKSGRYPKPMIWQVTWTTQAGHMQTKFFYLHLINYDNPDWVDDFWNHQMPEHPLVQGLLLTGAPAPEGDLFLKFLAHLSKPGALIWASYTYRDTGRALDPEDPLRLQQLINNGFASLLDYTGPRDNPMLNTETIRVLMRE